MANIVQYQVELTEIGVPVQLSYPGFVVETQFRVHDRFDVADPTPPNPKIVISALNPKNPPTPIPAVVERFFVLWPHGADLPLNWVKHVAQVVFGPDKITVDIHEVHSGVLELEPASDPNVAS